MEAPCFVCPVIETLYFVCQAMEDLFFVPKATEALYFCVPSFVFSQWRLYTFVCPVSSSSTRLRVPSVGAQSVCVSVQSWRLYTFVSTAMEALYVCVSN